MSLGTLTIDLAANVAGLESDLGKAQRIFEKNARNFERTVASTIAVASGLGAAGALGFAAMIKKSIDLADSFDEMSQRINVSAEDLSAYAYQAQFAGVTQEQLGGAFVKFNKVISDTFNGVGKGGEAFAALGISVTDTDGRLKTTAALFNEVAARMSEFEDGPQKFAVGMALFGKSMGPNLIDMLNGGAEGMKRYREEAERLGYVISNDTAKAAGEFNDNLDRLRKTIAGVANQTAAEALPNLAELTSVLQDPNIQQGIASFARLLLDTSGYAVKLISEVGTLYREIAGSDFNNLNQVDEQIKRIKQMLSDPTERLTFFGKDGLVTWYSEEELNTELAKLIEQRDNILKKNPPPPILVNSGSAPGASQKKKTFSSKKDDEFKEQIEAIEQAQASELSAMLETEKEVLKANEREVAAQREKFSRIHEERLAAEGKVIELENYRYQRERKLMEDELKLMREKGLVGSEIEAEYQKAKEDQAAAHKERIKKIEEKAEEEERKRKEKGYEALIGLAESYNNAKGRSTNRYTAVALSALKILSNKERMEAIKSVGRDGYVAIQKAWSSAPFPYNVGPVALATASAGANLVGVSGIAHGGLDYVPKEQTYLLDKGERVLSPNQNKDVTDFIRRGGGASVINIYNYSNAQVTAAQTGDSVEVYIGRVVDRINDQIMRGTGIANTLQQTYSLRRRGG